MKRALQEIVQTIKETATNSPLVLEGKEITSLSFEKLVAKERATISAIDGGSAPILQTPSAHVLFARIVRVTLDANFKKDIVKQEGFIIAHFSNKEHICAQFFSLTGTKELLCTIPLTEIKQIEETTRLAHIANSARKQLEWEEVLESTTTTLWDGIFTAQNSAEKVLAQKILAKENILGLAKTTTATGNWGVFAQSPAHAWKAQLFANTFFVKLQEKSTHYFRADTTNTSLLEEIPSWSNDPIFLGYPYPLILADQLARVSNAELSGLKIRLQSVLGKENKNSFNENATNAHAILDKIQF